jgi:hypothetical protein
MKPPDLLLIVGSCFTAFGCATSPESMDPFTRSKPGGGAFSPAYPWQTEADLINALESENADLKKWTTASPDSVRIATKDQLFRSFTGLNKAAQKEALNDFNSYDQTFHFSFETGGQALVFFTKEGQQKKVIKWSS